MKKAIFIYIVILLISLLMGCTKKAEEAQTQTENEEIQVPVLVETVQPRDLDRFVRVSGKLEGIVDITMVSETAGKIVSIEKNLGDWVTKDDPIGSVDNRDYRIMLDQAKASLLAAESQYEAAEASFQATENLYNQEKVSRVEYVTAKSSLKGALAQLEGAKAGAESAQKAYNNSRFLAPVSGYITYLPIEKGQYISMGSTVCNIVNSKRLIVKTGVNESDILFIRKGQKARIHHTGNGTEYEGTITGVGISPVQGTASYPVEIEIDNGDRQLFPGMVIEARIRSKTYEDVFYTSLNNVKVQYDEPYVFVIDKDNRAEHRKIVLGTTIEENIIITAGLKSGESLVVDGVDNLENGTLVDVRKPVE